MDSSWGILKRLMSRSLPILRRIALQSCWKDDFLWYLMDVCTYISDTVQLQLRKHKHPNTDSTVLVLPGCRRSSVGASWETHQNWTATDQELCRGRIQGLLVCIWCQLTLLRVWISIGAVQKKKVPPFWQKERVLNWLCGYWMRHLGVSRRTNTMLPLQP